MQGGKARRKASHDKKLKLLIPLDFLEMIVSLEAITLVQLIKCRVKIADPPLSENGQPAPLA